MTLEVEREAEQQKEEAERNEMNPPNGGWGVCVVIGYIIAGMTSIPIIQNFGLVYKGRLKDLQITSTQLTTIISMNSSVGQIMGIMGGPLLKKFGCRPVAFVAVSLLSIGSILTSLSQSFTHFILTHGIITSIGFTYTLTAFSMSLSSYFTTKRSRASGWLMGFTGIGPVVLPLFVTHSLATYGVFGTGLLLAALNFHGLVGACLLKPFPPKNPTPAAYRDLARNPFRFLWRWKSKTKKQTINVDEKPMSTLELPTTEINGSRRGSNFKRSASQNENELGLFDEHQQLPNIDAESTFGVESSGGYDLCRRRQSGSASNRRARSISESEYSPEPKEKIPEIVFYQSQPEAFKEENYRPDSLLSPSEDAKSLSKKSFALPAYGVYTSTETLDSFMIYHPNEAGNEEDNHRKSDEENKWYQRAWSFLHNQFDLDLLQDPVYISITLGMSIAIIGELIFSLLTPFILNEIGLDLQLTAYFMSTVATTDIIARFLSPYIGEWVHLPSRAMYILALFFLLFSRAGLLLVKNTAGAICVGLVIGAAKGVRTVFWGQVLPDHVPRAKLASAMSIQNLCNGILTFFAGPLAGLIVAINDSYLNIIYVSNALTAFTILIWTGEWLIVKCKKCPQKQEAA